jgi:8-oxo-dGTP diphosphatase
MVDLVLFTANKERLLVLLAEPEIQSDEDRWGLPGTSLSIDEDLDGAAQRLLENNLELPRSQLQQLYTFGAVKRDPRKRIVSVAYLGLVAPRAAATIAGETSDWAEVRSSTSGAVTLINPRDGAVLDSVLDHWEMIATAFDRLRRTLDCSDAAFGLLPDEFTLRELQHVHEVISGRKLNKPAFRRRMLDSGRLIGTGKIETGRAAFRPAELYRLRRPD